MNASQAESTYGTLSAQNSIRYKMAATAITNGFPRTSRFPGKTIHSIRWATPNAATVKYRLIPEAHELPNKNPID